jgi:hypothetical protein
MSCCTPYRDVVGLYLEKVNINIVFRFLEVRDK